MFEVGARSGHPTVTDIVAVAGIGLGIALQAFVGHPTNTDIVSRPAVYYQSAAVGAPAFPAQYEGLRIWYSADAHDLCLVDIADAPSGMGGVPRIRKNGVTYAIYLVDTTDGNASPVRIKTSAGVKSVRLRT